MRDKVWVKWTIFAIVCVLIVGSGVFCGVRWFQDSHTESYIRGSINLGNQFYAEEFKFPGDTVVLKKNGDNYSYTQDHLAKVPFDGVNNQYRFTFNHYIIYDAEYTAGTAKARISIDFYDTDNQLSAEIYFDIMLRFLSNRTELVITTSSEKNSQFANQYFADNNCRIVIEKINGGKNE